MTVEAGDLREPAEPAIDLERVRGAAALALTACDRGDAELSVTLVDDARIAELHERYLGIPGPTDVLSFPLEDDFEGPTILGEVVVSVDTAAREAQERGLTLERELLLYVIHGTLHLLGYDDRNPDDRARMEARQEELLEAFLSLRPRPERERKQQ